LRGAARLLRIGADLGGDRLGQRGHARDLVGHRAQLRLVGDGLQAVAHRLQALLEVLVEEEPGVGEARADHALVALAHLGHVLRLDVGDADEVLGQPAAGVQHREELLVDLHRLDQRFLRHGEEVALEAAQHGRRPFGQAHHLLEVVLGDAGGAAGLSGRLLRLGDDARAAFLRIDQHARALQRVHVVARLADPHRLVVLEAVAAAHAVGLHAQHFHVDHVAAQQHHQPVHRAGEGVVVAAPAHRFGDRHAGDGLGDDLRQQLDGARARLHRAVHETLALGVGGALQRGPLHPGLGGEAFQRLRRAAFAVQRDVHVGAEHLGALLRLFGGHARQQHRQAPRGVQRARVAHFHAYAALAQRRDHTVEEGLGQARQRLDRQLLGAQFDQQGFLFAHVVTLGLPFSREKVAHRAG
jgi:hypothetical protein